MKLKKGSAEAKRYMASIRAKKKGAKKTATKKRAVKKAPTKKRASKKISSHKDTKSHNVNISVVSGVDKNTMILHDLKVFENRRTEAINKEIFFTNHAKKFSKNTIEHKLNLKYANEYKRLVKYYTIQIGKLKKLLS